MTNVSDLASKYGYRFVTTGGNCTGYEQDLESNKSIFRHTKNDKSILITTAEDWLAPISPNDLCVAYLYTTQSQILRGQCLYLDDQPGDYVPISQPLEFCKLLVLLKRPSYEMPLFEELVKNKLKQFHRQI